MNILSLFDGLSTAQIALNQLGIKYENYFASEIDKYCIQITQKNYPDTIQLGDITKINGEALPKIDLLIGGSPCQGFSIAGKQLNFDDPRSKLFFEYVRLLQECTPKYFLLENVKMKKEYQDIISKHIGVEPIEINSALFSAQNRKRLYWTNIKVDELSKDKGILLKDIIEKGVVDRDKSYCIDANYYKGTNIEQYLKRKRRQIVFCDKPIQIGIAKNINGKDILKRIYSIYGKSPTITAVCGGHQEKKIAINDYQYRKLTPIECERLQTIPDNYTAGVSNTQRYKMLGNSFTVEVIKFILKNIKELI